MDVPRSRSDSCPHELIGTSEKVWLCCSRLGAIEGYDGGSAGVNDAAGVATDAPVEASPSPDAENTDGSGLAD